MDKVITGAVDRYITEQNPERGLDGMWHPSSLSSPCRRRAILEKRMLPFSNPPDEETKRIFMLGKIIHRLVQDAVSKDPNIVLVIPEIEVNDPENEVTGQADILIYRYDTQEYELIEIKSIKSAGVYYGIPKNEHKIQAGVYAMVLKSKGGTYGEGTILPPLGKALTKVRFVYVEKENMAIHERVEDADELATLARDRLDSLQYLDELNLLPTVSAAGQWFKRYCPYAGSGNCCGDK